MSGWGSKVCFLHLPLLAPEYLDPTPLTLPLSVSSIPLSWQRSASPSILEVGRRTYCGEISTGVSVFRIDALLAGDGIEAGDWYRGEVGGALDSLADDVDAMVFARGGRVSERWRSRPSMTYRRGRAAARR